MGQPFLGQIMMFGGNFAPQGFAFCNGQLMAIAQNDALFALIGTTYGGDGVTTFGLPDLRSRIPIHQGQGPGLGNYVLGEVLGTETVTLTTNQIPQHNHIVTATQATTNLPSGNTFGGGGVAAYKAGPPGPSMNAAVVNPNSGNQPHENLMPFLVITFVIAVEGIFPSRN
jgi:microcystin-dependent protein